MVTITSGVRRRILNVVNIFEFGKPADQYDNISKLNDGAHGIKQITYGLPQATEQSDLEDLLHKYASYNGKFAQQQTAIFNEDLKKSRRITFEQWQKRPWQDKLFEHAAALFRSQL